MLLSRVTYKNVQTVEGKVITKYIVEYQRIYNGIDKSLILDWLITRVTLGKKHCVVQQDNQSNSPAAFTYDTDSHRHFYRHNRHKSKSQSVIED